MDKPQPVQMALLNRWFKALGKDANDQEIQVQGVERKDIDSQLRFIAKILWHRSISKAELTGSSRTQKVFATKP